MDVLKQLEQRLREQILAQRKTSSNESTKQTLIKLERDFERVQATAQSYKSKVTRQQKQFQQRGGGTSRFIGRRDDMDFFVTVSCADKVFEM